MTTSLAFELDRDEIRHRLAGADAVHGTIRLEQEDLVIDYRVVRRAGTDEGSARIPLERTTKIMMTGGALKSPRLVIDVARDEDPGGIPWAVGRQCVLRFARADGQALRELIEECEVRLARLAARRRRQE